MAIGNWELVLRSEVLRRVVLATGGDNDDVNDNGVLATDESDESDKETANGNGIFCHGYHG
jgi:hypothetical protein